MDDLNAASVEDVATFFKTYYAPNNAVLVDRRRRRHQEDDGAGREVLRVDPVAAAADAADICRAAAHRRAAQHDRGSAGAAAARRHRLDRRRPPARPTTTRSTCCRDVLSSGRSARLNQVDRPREAARDRTPTRRSRQSAARACSRSRHAWRPARAPRTSRRRIYEEIEKVKTGPIADWEIEKAHNNARRNRPPAVDQHAAARDSARRVRALLQQPEPDQHAHRADAEGRPPPTCSASRRST